jgi:hypothetical protein
MDNDNFGSSYSNDTTNPNITIPARSRSIKATFSMQRDVYPGGKNVAAAPATHQGHTGAHSRDSTNGCFLTSAFSQCGLTSYHYTVGSVQFPVQAISLDASGRSSVGESVHKAQNTGAGCAQAYCELLKCFGTLGSIDHTTSLSSTSYSQTGYSNPGPGDFVKAFAIGYSLDSFSRSVIESGVNSSDRAL